jgi:predicted nuclease of predicted toxin-antitoxin system
VKWLVDAQLPPSLCDWVRERNDDAIHVSEISDGLSLQDETIWNLAKREEFVIISKDRDFFERSIVFGSPPQVVHLDVGNCSNEKLYSLLHQHWGEIRYAIRKEKSLIVVSKMHILTY